MTRAEGEVLTVGSETWLGGGDGAAWPCDSETESIANKYHAGLNLPKMCMSLRPTIPVSRKTPKASSGNGSPDPRQRRIHSILAVNTANMATAPSVALYSRCFQYKSHENAPRPLLNHISRGSSRGTCRADPPNSGKCSLRNDSSPRMTGK